MKRAIMIVSVLSLLAGCSQYASTGENLYLNSHNGPKLNVPPPLSSALISSFYVLPNQTENPVVSIAPPQ